LLADFVAHPGLAAGEVGHNVGVALRAGDLDVTDFQAGPIEKKGLADFWHFADGKAQYHKASDGIVGDHSRGGGNGGGDHRLGRRRRKD